MNFSGDVRLAKVMLHSDDDNMHPLDFSMSMTPKAAYEIAVKNNLVSGRYTVYWTAMGGDSHKISKSELKRVEYRNSWIITYTSGDNKSLDIMMTSSGDFISHEEHKVE